MAILEKAVFYFEADGNKFKVEVTSGQFEILWKRTTNWNEFWEVLAKMETEWKGKRK